MRQHQFSQRLPLFKAHAARAQRHNNGQGEADEQVSQADADNAQKGHNDQADFRAAVNAHQALHEIGGGEGNMADIQRQAQNKAQRAHASQHDPEEEVPGQRAEVALYIGRELIQALLAQHALQGRMRLQARANLAVDGHIVKIAGQQPG